jgi:soluble cytochrome b562
MKIYRIKQILKECGRRKIGGEEGLVQNKAAFFEFMERYPVRKTEAGRQKIKGGGLILTLKPMPIIVGIIIATLLAGGGTAYASQGSLPGDALYPVKLMAEDVQMAAAWNSEKKVEMETKFANRRLEEVQKLQEKLRKKNGEIKPEVVEKAMERAEERLNKAESRIAEMEDGVLKEKALEAASYLEEALRDHEQLLSDLAGEIPDKAEQALLNAQAKAALHAERAMGVISRLEKRQELKDKIREKAKEEDGKIMGVEERAEGKLNAIENKLEAAENYLEKLKEQGRDVSNYEVKLDEAKTKLDEAKKLLEEGKYLEAFQAANKVMRALIEAKGVLRPIIMPRPLPVERESDESGVSPEMESVETGEPGESSESGEAVRGTITPLPAVLPVVQ